MQRLQNSGKSSPQLSARSQNKDKEESGEIQTTQMMSSEDMRMR
jgi:hypothetical protein